MSEDILVPILEQLEEERIASQATVKNLMIYGGLASVAIVSFLFYSGMAFGAFFLAAILAIGIFGIRRKLQNKVVASFKSNVIPTILAKTDNSLQYSLAGCIEKNEFMASSLFMKPDRYKGKDLVSGKVGKTDIRFSLVHAEEEHETHDTDSDGHSTTKTEYRDIFKGLFFSADFNKHLSSSTLVRSGASGFLSQLFGSNVKLEDPRFNNLFQVKSSDQVEARYILTPSLMERMVELRDKFKSVDLSFSGSRVNLAIPLPYNLFDPNLKVPLTDQSHVESLSSSLDLILGIVNDLDLNTRIWSKAS